MEHRKLALKIVRGGTRVSGVLVPVFALRAIRLLGRRTTLVGTRCLGVGAPVRDKLL